MRTVTLELLRHGPPHNQLLSPLTQYLGLCANHAAVTVRLPFEHAYFQARLRSLSYKDSAETRQLQLAEMAKLMGELLSTVPGLIAELNACAEQKSGMVHLRLILSANELALLPLELATAPNGFPGAGQSLALQTQVPLSITREVRRVVEPVEWPSHPRILFAAASPAGVGDIPLHAHLLALRKVIEPWIKYYEKDNKASRAKRVAEHLTVLPQASVASLQQACATGEYTHVHILAHGINFQHAGDQRFGLALHDSSDPRQTDIVDGVRLATLLRTHKKADGRALVRPAVVTLASCDSGNIGSVVGAGASIAHALHEAGIPLVVASQFPLTFHGSIIMTQVLYEGLLWGEDPRLLLDDLRRRLRTGLADTHDWGSVVAYVALPLDIDRQLLDVSIRRAQSCIEAALDWADRSMDSMSGPAGEKKAAGELWESFGKELNEARLRMRDLLKKGQNTAEIYGLLASAGKRLAEVLWRATAYHQIVDNDAATFQRRAVASLDESREDYRKAFEAARQESWALVQELVLAAVLEGGSEVDADAWRLAHFLSRLDLESEDLQRRAWAHGNMIELCLLALLRNEQDLMPWQAAEFEAFQHTDELKKLAKSGKVELYTTRRQLARYPRFFEEVKHEPRWNTVSMTALRLHEELPKSRLPDS